MRSTTTLAAAVGLLASNSLATLVPARHHAQAPEHVFKPKMVSKMGGDMSMHRSRACILPVEEDALR